MASSPPKAKAKPKVNPIMAMFNRNKEEQLTKKVDLIYKGFKI